MKPQPSPGSACTDPTIPPCSVRVLRTLGHGRAAQAELVEAVMPDGQVVTCVEKVFAPGLLTRTIYRLSFQSPFAYQSNRDAILACFYRRRVAAAVLAGSDIDASIASPLYVRFDQSTRSWVLAAEWIDGRGITPAPADASRIRRWVSASKTPGTRGEIDVLVETMSRLEAMFADSGLVGSGWQVAPRALVSTANLLRTGQRYTIIDLESGIPAVLVPKYLLAGVRHGSLPPFDDLDANRLRSWIEQNERLLTFRLGPEKLAQLHHDSEKLIEHSSRWKESEFALFRRPWGLFSRRRSRIYQQECFRRWQQNEVVDPTLGKALSEHPIRARLIWYAGLLPFALGRFCSRLIGRKDYRTRVSQCLRDSTFRAAQWQELLQRRQTRWVEAERITPSSNLSTRSFLLHFALSGVTPARLHRFITDRKNRRYVATSLLLLLFSQRYQSWFGHSRIEASIDCWTDSKRICEQEADQLRSDLSGNEVRAYTRGFGMHVALKALAPIIVPAKVGGVAAFLASGNLWFLLPMLATPLMRTAVTLTSWWTTRHEHVPHGEALAVGWLPVVGSIGFLLQMFSTRRRLSTFLIRDAASMLGRKVPVYGGADSRTEIGLIRATDLLVELMECMSLLAQRIFQTQRVSRDSSAVQTPQIQPRTRFGNWIDRKAINRISETDSRAKLSEQETAIESNAA
jgi:hypothetical protein